jgi:hypothetical protein
MSGLDPDGPVPNLKRNSTHAKVAYEKARKDNPTLRDIYNQFAVARGYLFGCGDAAMVADIKEEGLLIAVATASYWCRLTSLPLLMKFIDLFVTELRGRGIFRRAHSGLTFCEHLASPAPINRCAKRMS